LGLKPERLNLCFFKRKEGGDCLGSMIAFYVDNIVISCSTIKQVKKNKQRLSSRFNMKDLGILREEHGGKINHKEGNIELPQEEYIKSFIERDELQVGEKAKTPLLAGALLHQTLDDET
jgi:Reverse transcriptase (RNA-dependent DNA polymerase)